MDSFPPDKRTNESADSQILIRDWALKHQISYSSLRELLNILRNHYDLQLPSDPRTLCNIPSELSNKIRQIYEGEYFYFGL